MGNKYVFYVETQFRNECIRNEANVLNPLSLVIADSQIQAIEYMSNILMRYDCTVTFPTFRDTRTGCVIKIPNLSYYGHGMPLSQFISNPRNMEKYRNLIDLYFPRAPRHKLQMFDERGEVMIQNGKPLIENPDDAANPFNYPTVLVDIENLDSFEMGTAFVSDTNANYSRGLVVVAEKITDVTTAKTTIKQTMITPQGEVLTRTRINFEWTSWSKTSAYPEEAPNDGEQYVRKNKSWDKLVIDDTPQSGSKALITSDAVKSYVDTKMTTVYQFRRTYSDADFFQSLTVDSPDAVVGYVYNYSGPKITIKQPQSDVPYDIDAIINETADMLLCSQSDAQLFPVGQLVTIIQTDTNGTRWESMAKVSSAEYNATPQARIHLEVQYGTLIASTKINGVVSELPLELDPGDNIAVIRIGSHVFLDEFATTVDLSDYMHKSHSGNGDKFLNDKNEYAFIPQCIDATSIFTKNPQLSRSDFLMKLKTLISQEKLRKNQFYRCDGVLFTDNKLYDRPEYATTYFYIDEMSNRYQAYVVNTQAITSLDITAYFTVGDINEVNNIGWQPIFSANQLVGRITEEGGEIFNDYNHNRAGAYSSASGYYSNACPMGYKVAGISSGIVELAEDAIDIHVGDRISTFNGTKWISDKITAVNGRSIHINMDTNSFKYFVMINGGLHGHHSIQSLISDHYDYHITSTSDGSNTFSGPGTATFGYEVFGGGVANLLGGYNNNLIGNYNLMGGINNNVKSDGSVIGGIGTETRANNVLNVGEGTLADNHNVRVTGRFNIRDTEHKYLDIVGNGSSDENRSNAYTLDEQGNGEFAGDVTSHSEKRIHKLSEKANQSDVYLKTETYSANQIDNCCGDYAVTPVITGVTATLGINIRYPVVYTHYNVLVNNKKVGDAISADKYFTSAAKLFDNSVIIIELYNNNTKVLSMIAEDAFYDKVIKMGHLSILE